MCWSAMQRPEAQLDNILGCPPPLRGQHKHAGRVPEVDKRVQSLRNTFLLPSRIFIRGSGFDSRGSEVFLRCN